LSGTLLSASSSPAPIVSTTQRTPKKRKTNPVKDYLQAKSQLAGETMSSKFKNGKKNL
jgi:hypothetical protein